MLFSFYCGFFILGDFWIKLHYNYSFTRKETLENICGWTQNDVFFQWFLGCLKICGFETLIDYFWWLSSLHLIYNLGKKGEYKVFLKKCRIWSFEPEFNMNTLRIRCWYSPLSKVGWVALLAITKFSYTHDKSILRVGCGGETRAEGTNKHKTRSTLSNPPMKSLNWPIQNWSIMVTHNILNTNNFFCQIT